MLTQHACPVLPHLVLDGADHCQGVRAVSDQHEHDAGHDFFVAKALDRCSAAGAASESHPHVFKVLVDAAHDLADPLLRIEQHGRVLGDSCPIRSAGLGPKRKPL